MAKVEEEPERDYRAELLEGPEKCVRVITDMYDWQQSEAYYSLMGFINGISTAIQGVRISDDYHVSEQIKKFIKVLEILNGLIDQTPPVDQPQRYGNKAYRSWTRKMYHCICMLLQEALPADKCELVSELSCYLGESFGNSVRLDYGTGHELSFMFFLCGLFKAEILVEDDNTACALKLFNSYLQLVRRLQKTYRMEPAGSQGVWSLDDYQFIPFIWGSAQFAKDPPFDPTKFLDEPKIEAYKDDYIFMGCIDYINQVKTGHFAEHSNQLWSISAVQSWVKINTGLVKMYQKEILSKYPIIQHTMFGKLMSFKPVKPGTGIPPPIFQPENPSNFRHSSRFSARMSHQHGHTEDAGDLPKTTEMMLPPASNVMPGKVIEKKDTTKRVEDLSDSSENN